jgi:hypothetical protein
MGRLRPKYRQGRCYELAWRYQAIDERYADWTLVHGEIVSPIGDGEPMGHAWLQQSDTIHDPVSDGKFGLQDYMTKYKAQVIACYSQREAAQIAVQNGHYGPWHGVPVCGNRPEDRR